MEPKLNPHAHWPASVGVVIRCHQHSGLAARLIRFVRPYVDEVVVVADEMMSAAAIGALAAAEPTTLVRIPHAFPNERATVYEHSLCRSGWSLRLAGDEVPSVELLEDLRQLASDKRVTHYRIPVRWMWRDPRTALDDMPWRFDFHIRFFRNDAAISHFDGITHGSLNVAGNYRYLAAPIYHLVFLVTSEESRREKAQRYAMERPGMKYRGRSFNEAWYLPESRALPLSLAPVPHVDTAAMREIVGTSLEGDAPPLQLPVLSLNDVDAHWAAKPWSPDAYRARLTPEDTKIDFDENGNAAVIVRVANLGGETFPSAAATLPLIRLSYHWLDDSGISRIHDGLRTALPSPLAPGEEMLVPVSIETPGAGEWILELDLVHESVRWFGINTRVPVTIA
ncbi:MAG: hypothetical protein ACJ8JD_07305 [Chthoniobacterales bacterium]